MLFPLASTAADCLFTCPTLSFLRHTQSELGDKDYHWLSSPGGGLREKSYEYLYVLLTLPFLWSDVELIWKSGSITPTSTIPVWWLQSTRNSRWQCGSLSSRSMPVDLATGRNSPPFGSKPSRSAELEDVGTKESLLVGCRLRLSLLPFDSWLLG